MNDLPGKKNEKPYHQNFSITNNNLPEPFISKLNSNHLTRYNNIVNILDEYLMDFMAMNIKYFTRHGRIHSLGVIDNIKKLLPQCVLNELNSSELLILLSSAWLHDIGLLRCKNRGEHNKVSAEIIRDENFYKKIGINDPHLADAIALVSYWHSRSAGQINIRTPISNGSVLGERVNLKLLIALFRLSDALDISSKRAPSIIFKEIIKMPEFSDAHWKMNELVNIYFNTDNKNIVYDAIYRDDFEKNLIIWKYYDLVDEFKSVENCLFLGENKVWKGVKGFIHAYNPYSAPLVNVFLFFFTRDFGLLLHGLFIFFDQFHLSGVYLCIIFLKKCENGFQIIFIDQDHALGQFSIRDVIQ